MPDRRATQARLAPATAPQQKSNIVPNPSYAASPKPVAPTVLQARPGATTTLISKQPAPPPHQQTGLPKIAATPGLVDRATLLPQRGPQGAAARPAPAASAPALPQSLMPAPSDTPGLGRRLACFVYEGVLLFGVLMLAGWLFATLTQQRHALQGKVALQAVLFVVLAIYFVWFWTHGGQTLAMKTWHIRVVRHDGAPLGKLRALARYVVAWLWFLPALLALWLAPRSSVGAMVGVLATGVVAYALTSLLHPQRQFWHDAVCGTRLVVWKPADESWAAGTIAAHDKPVQGAYRDRSDAARNPLFDRRAAHGVPRRECVSAGILGRDRVAAGRLLASAAAGSKWRCWPARCCWC